MKLTDEQAVDVPGKLGLSPISEEHEAHAQLANALGEHTFFIGEKGLFVFAPPSDEEGTPTSARLFVVATWSDEEKNKLAPVNPPAAVDVVLDLADGTISTGS